jgi:hypothetical protein
MWGVINVMSLCAVSSWWLCMNMTAVHDPCMIGHVLQITTSLAEHVVVSDHIPRFDMFKVVLNGS